MEPACASIINALARDDFAIGDAVWTEEVENARRHFSWIHPEDGFVLIAQEEPMAYAAYTLVGLSLSFSLLLANPQWGSSEWEQLAAQCTPAHFFGTVPQGVFAGTVDRLPAHLRGCLAVATGGSGGRLKFCIHNLDTLSNAAFAVSAFFELEAMRSVCVLPLYHVSGLIQVIRSAVSGGNIAFISSRKWMKSATYPYFNDWQISVVPTLLRRWLAEPFMVKKLRAFSHIFTGGASTDRNLLTSALHVGLRVCPCYGMTETAAMILAVRPQDVSEHGLAGEVLPHARLELAGEEIFVRATSLHRGYLHEVLKVDTLSPLIEYATGDTGEALTNGRWLIHGRLDTAINTGGEKVYPHEVEQCLKEHLQIEQVCVLGLEDGDWGRKVACAYVVRSGSHVSENELQDWLRTRLANYKLPKAWLRLEHLPENDRGKVDIARIREKFFKFLNQHQ